jgi:hypothetical protein
MNESKEEKVFDRFEKFNKLFNQQPEPKVIVQKRYTPEIFQEESISIMVKAATASAAPACGYKIITASAAPACGYKIIAELADGIESSGSSNGNNNNNPEGFECQMKYNCQIPFGRILADEMGLGKTSQMLETVRRIEQIRVSRLSLDESALDPSNITDPRILNKEMTWKNNNLRYIFLVPKSMLTVWKKESYMVCSEFGKRVHVCDEKLRDSRNVPLHRSLILITTAGLLRTAMGALTLPQTPLLLKDDDDVTPLTLRGDADAPPLTLRGDANAPPLTPLLKIGGKESKETKSKETKGNKETKPTSAKKGGKGGKGGASATHTGGKGGASATPCWIWEKEWDGLVVDEAHKCLANGVFCTKSGNKFREDTKKKTTQSIYKLKRKCTWLVTGTIAENKASELVSLAKCLLDDKHPWGNISNWSCKTKEESKKMIEDFRNQFIIRRTDEVLGLPEMKKNIVSCPMSEQQKKCARENMHSAMNLLTKMEKSKAIKKSNYQMQVLAMINQLRLNNDSPLLLKRYKTEEAMTRDKEGRNRMKKKKKFDDDGIIHPSWNTMSRKDILKSSPKIEKIVELTEQCVKNGEQVLIFSYFVETLKLLSKVLGGEASAPPLTPSLSSRGTPPLNPPSSSSSNISSSSSSNISSSKDRGVKGGTSGPPSGLKPGGLGGSAAPPPIFTGKTSGEERETLIKDFQSGKIKVLLLSQKAGGLGITLTAATRVILTNLWWNGSNDIQSIKRTHRRGQTKIVNVHRFIVEEPDSIDMWMLALQQSKLEETKLIIPDLHRYSDCFTLNGDKNTDLFSYFKSWIKMWCDSLGENTAELAREIKEKENRKRKASEKSRKKNSKKKKKKKKNDDDDDDDDYSEDDELIDLDQDNTSDEYLDDDDDLVEKKKNKMWQCLRCTIFNDPTQENCRMCGY